MYELQNDVAQKKKNVIYVCCWERNQGILANRDAGDEKTRSCNSPSLMAESTVVAVRSNE